MKKIYALAFLMIVLVTLVACAASPNDMANTPDEEGHVAGVWLGLWHGIIAPITFVISLFSDTVTMYEIHNNGGWYNFGFLLGLAIIWGGGGAAGARRS